MLERSGEEMMGGKGVGTHVAEEGLLHTGQLQLTSFEVFMPAWMKCWCWLKQQTRGRLVPDVRRKLGGGEERRGNWALRSIVMILAFTLSILNMGINLSA